METLRNGFTKLKSIENSMQYFFFLLFDVVAFSGLKVLIVLNSAHVRTWLFMVLLFPSQAVINLLHAPMTCNEVF